MPYRREPHLATPAEHCNNLRGPQSVCEDLVRFIALLGSRARRVAPELPHWLRVRICKQSYVVIKDGPCWIMTGVELDREVAACKNLV